MVAAPYAGKNLILLSIDTLRADHLPAYGYARPTAPHLERLANEGVVFEKAFAPRGHTWPSLTTLFTSQYPRSTNVRGPTQLLARSFPTAVDALEASGYRTVAFVANYCTPARTIFQEMQCGFDEKVVVSAVQWLEQHSGQQPFFLWVHFLKPHLDYVPLPEFDRFTDEDYAGRINGSKDSARSVYAEQLDISEDERAHIQALYDGDILEADALMGRVIHSIDRRDLFDESIVVFSSDHGEELYQHNKFVEHGCSIYDSVLHVPLMMRFPDKRWAGARIPDVVGLIDLMPTLLDLLGVEKLPSFQGESFSGRLTDGTRKDFSAVISEHYRRRQGGEVLSIRTARWRYIYNPKGVSPYCLPAKGHYPIDAEELYDHRSDPQELENVVHLHPQVVARLRKELLQRYPPMDGGSAPLETDDPETLDRLKALGYIEDD